MEYDMDSTSVQHFQYVGLTSGDSVANHLSVTVGETHCDGSVNTSCMPSSLSEMYLLYFTICVILTALLLVKMGLLCMSLSSS